MPNETVEVKRGETRHILRVPTPDELNEAVISAAMAVGALQGIAEGLEGNPDVGHVVPTVRSIAADLERFVDLVDPDPPLTG